MTTSHPSPPAGPPSPGPATPSAGAGSEPASAARRRYVPAVGPRLRRVLDVVFGLFALLAVNAAYLLAVRLLEGATGRTYQNWFYLVMFLGHLALGLLFVVPVVVFGFVHMANARHRRNRRAVRVGYALFAVALVLLASGIVLTRIEGVIVVKDPAVRSVAWWLHVLTPIAAAWLFVLHRLAGKRIQWRLGLRWAVVAAVLAAVLVALQAQDPRQWNVQGPESGEQYFFPSLARTATGDFIPARVLANDAYCQECHADVHERWSHSVHRFSSFNNPPYLFSVRETRRVSLERDGDVSASRFCAGCHDPVPFFSGRFDDPQFDDVNDPTAHSGITCTTCHAITHVAPRGNSDYTIEEPLHYPFAFSDSAVLGSINRQLVKAKPELHKRTFLKPLHRSPEFCGACHKVHLPEELNKYKWLRGQDHQTSYLLSGVSGHGVQSFYYPPKAETSCNGCHMGLLASEDFGAKDYDGEGGLEVHDHLFPAANTAIPHLLDMPDWVIEEHRRFNEGVMRVDLFGVRDGGLVDSPLVAPLRPAVPALVPGRSYLLETVIRTVKMGHHFTQGTADSNEVWLDVTVTADGRVIGRSGGMDEEGRVDPWSHFVNVYMLDRHGNRIDRRNAQDIFTPLYNHQIPPGAADVVHYRLDLPAEITGPVTVEVRLRYRKFDTTYMKLVYGPDYVNDLPVLELAADRVTFPVAGRGAPPAAANPPSAIEEWQRWNDYGIALLLKGTKGQAELRQAEEAFTRVEELGRADGALNLARVYIAQGTVRDKAIAALERATRFAEPAPSWSVAWFTGIVNKQNGHLDEAIANFRSIVELDDAETRRRDFDFSQDWRVLDELGQTLLERARRERGPARREAREALVREAVGWFERALTLEPEDAVAHYNLALAYRELGDAEKAAEHRAAHAKYRPDDNARDRVIAIARAKDPAADHAAEAIVLYDLRRPGAFGARLVTPSMLPATPPRGSGRPFTFERLVSFRRKVDLQHQANAAGALLEHLESEYAIKRAQVAADEGVSEAEIDRRVARALGKPAPGEGGDEMVPEDDAVIGRAVRWSLVALAVLAALALVIYLLVRGGETARAERAIAAAPPERVAPAGEVPALPFADVTAQAGIRFVHFNGAYGDKLLPETMGGGGAFFDHDGDGDPDLLLVNGAPWPWAPRRPASPPTQALYRNDGGGRFTDVTAAAGLDLTLYGQGVAVGDFDDDGDPDLYLTAVGENRLLENRGGRYVDVTERAGVGGGEAWSTAAAFFDADADGDLDLFVANYVQWSRAIDFEVDYRLTGVGRAYGPPMNYRGAHSKLYRNEGGGRFADVSAEAGIEVVNPATGEPAGKALAVLPTDVDADGHLDLLVANDTVGNFFFHNQGDGTFVEDGTERGLAFDRMGRATGAMGVDAGWYRNDPELGFLIGNFANEMSSLYVSQGDPSLFADEAIAEGVGAASRSTLTFGMLLADFDLDGRLDMVQTNGHIEDEIAAVDPSQTYRQPAQLFWNAGPDARSTFVEVPREVTGDLARPLVGRGSAAADVDGDGDLDLALFQAGAAPLLLENRQALGHHWLRVRLAGDPAAGSNRDAIGAVVELTAGGTTQRRQVNPTRSYLSQSELPLTFGLGTAERVERLEITWPSGERQVLEDLPVDRVLVVEEEGSPAP